jgi:hypothetical protein
MDGAQYVITDEPAAVVKPLTIGRVAIAVFLGNLLTAAVAGGLYYLATH